MIPEIFIKKLSIRVLLTPLIAIVAIMAMIIIPGVSSNNDIGSHVLNIARNMKPDISIKFSLALADYCSKIKSELFLLI